MPKRWVLEDLSNKYRFGKATYIWVFDCFSDAFAKFQRHDASAILNDLSPPLLKDSRFLRNFKPVKGCIQPNYWSRKRNARRKPTGHEIQRNS